MKSGYILFYFLSVALSFNINSDSNIALYWGQNSEGSQTRLRDYCDDNSDIILLSFITSFPNNLQLNFANQCDDTFSSGLLKCDNIGEDIKYCQKKGKIVMLSMGGASGSYGFLSDSEGEDFAKVLWNKFAGGSDDERPFGDAIVDGFDFDFEQNQQTGIAALGNGLRDQFKKDSSKQYYLSGAPQCPYPDASVGDLMTNVDLDFAFIQFYNNYCNLGSNFNWDTWQDYASNDSPNKNIKLFLGQPGGPTGAGSGYNDLSVLKKYINQVKNTANFGGVSLWDASQAYSNINNGVNYAESIKSIIGGSSSDSGKLVDSETTSSASKKSTSKTSTSTSKTSTSTSKTSTSKTSTSTSKTPTSTSKTSTTTSKTSTSKSHTTTSKASTSKITSTGKTSLTKASTSESSTKKLPVTSSSKVTIKTLDVTSKKTASKTSSPDSLQIESTITEIAKDPTTIADESSNVSTSENKEDSSYIQSTTNVKVMSEGDKHATESSTAKESTEVTATENNSVTTIFATPSLISSGPQEVSDSDIVTSTVDDDDDDDDVVRKTITRTKHSSIVRTKTVTGKRTTKTFTKTYPTTVTTVRITGTTTKIVTKYLDPPDF